MSRERRKGREKEEEREDGREERQKIRQTERGREGGRQRQKDISALWSSSTVWIKYRWWKHEKWRGSRGESLEDNQPFLFTLLQDLLVHHKIGHLNPSM